MGPNGKMYVRMNDGDDHGREHEVNSHRAHLSGYVLVAGLVFELVNAVKAATSRLVGARFNSKDLSSPKDKNLFE